jgi:peptide/nickel transport system ATP-binding protein
LNGAVLRVNDLRVVVPGSHAIVDGLTFSLQPGEVMGLVGESGSGKTTVALALVGYARRGMQLRGSVQIGDVDMITAPEAARQRVRGTVISYVPQDPATSLNPALRIGAQLRDRLRRQERNDADPATRIEEVLETVDLPGSREFLRRYPHQLSGGQMQRVCIALAVLCRPRVMVLDEPTTGLDVMTQARVLELISQLISAEDMAAFYVTHDLAVVSGLAHRLCVMYSGLFMEEGTTGTLLRNPLHPYTRRLIRSTPSLRERRSLIGIGGTALNPRDRIQACPFSPRCEFAAAGCTERLPALRLADRDHHVRCARVEEFQAPSGLAESAPSASPWIMREPAGTDPLVDVQSLSASYGNNEVLHGVALSVHEGECLAVVGESGSGKTTLGRCISGLHTGHARGTLRLRGQEISLHPAERTQPARRGIQYIFQSPYASLNPRHRVGRSIALPLEVFGLSAGRRRAAVRELLERVALNPDYESRFPAQLSGGERQRVAIARALAAQPSVLVCDEITSSLDVSIQAAILELLGKLRREMNLTIIFITHHLALVRAVADRAVIMRDGMVIEEGSAAEVLDQPRNPYTRGLITATPVLAGTSETLTARGQGDHREE